jgi:hypothetical protein
MSRVQSPRQEIIGELKAMMMVRNVTPSGGSAYGFRLQQCLRRYFDMTKNVLPSQIFFFRDGVSEGELEQVERFEIQAIQGT